MSLLPRGARRFGDAVRGVYLFVVTQEWLILGLTVILALVAFLYEEIAALGA